MASAWQGGHKHAVGLRTSKWLVLHDKGEWRLAAMQHLGHRPQHLSGESRSLLHGRRHWAAQAGALGLGHHPQLQEQPLNRGQISSCTSVPQQTR